jgi:beta-lactamase class A
MQGYQPVRQPASNTAQPFFFIARTMVMTFLLVIGSLAFLPSSRAHAQGALLSGRNSIIHAVIYDVTSQRYFTYHASSQFITASSMKVPILLTFLDMIEQQGREPTTHEMRLLTTMIENSNNDSASALYYGEIGGAAGVKHFMQKIGISGLFPNPRAWGWSLITPLAMVKLLTFLYKGNILTAHDRQLALYLMEHVEADQREGVGDIAPRGATVALKDGWVIAPDSWWAVNSSGIVMTAGKTYIISVYTKGEPSVGAGLAAIRGGLACKCWNEVGSL